METSHLETSNFDTSNLETSNFDTSNLETSKVTALTSRKLRKFQVLVLTRMVSFSLLCDFQVALRAAVTRQAQIGGNGCPVSECWRGEEAG